LATNRLGFRGTEDLGGGLSAFFTAEMQLTPTDSNSFTNMTNRQSFIGLGKKGLGNAAVGTQYTPIFNAMTATNPGANNNVVGSIIFPLTNANATNSEALTIRRNNSLMLTTERFGGFRAQGMYFANNSDTTVTANNAGVVTAGGTANSFGYGLAVDYTWKKLLVTAAYQLNKAETTLGAAATIAGLAGNNTDTQLYAAATYDFGILKAYANWINRKVVSAVDSNQYVQRSGQQIGVRGDVTKQITAWANIGTGRYDSFGPGTPTANFNAWQ
jgi:predicted porin